jgi:hypothetical protein
MTEFWQVEKELIENIIEKQKNFGGKQLVADNNDLIKS